MKSSEIYKVISFKKKTLGYVSASLYVFIYVCIYLCIQDLDHA